MKLFIFILLTFSALNPVLVYSSCEEAFLPLTSVQEEAQKSVWTVKSSYVAETRSGIALGTGFFINKDTFVTNFYGVSKVLTLNDINGITLTQEGNPRTLKIKGIIHLSVTDNLAVLEIEGAVIDSLNLTSDIPIPQENLFITIGYPNGNSQVINTTGDILNSELYYTVLGSHSNNSRASGSPVLNTDGEVVGVYHAQNGNALHAVKIIHLQNLLKQKVELFRSPKDHLEHSIKEVIEAAEQGDVIAQLHLGYLYENGYSIEQDYQEASKWYKKSAEQGNVIAQYYLGSLYFSGQGVKQDNQEAFKWFEKAAKQGYASAQYSLALLYHLGQGVEQDHQKAFDLCKKAAEQGYALAQNNLSIFYKALNIK